jgi:hypothetical protein
VRLAIRAKPGSARASVGVRRRDVILVTGATSRDKVVEVDGDPGALAARRDILLG